MPSPTDHSSAVLSAHRVREISVRAYVSPRSVRKYYTNPNGMLPLTRERIRRVLAAEKAAEEK